MPEEAPVMSTAFSLKKGIGFAMTAFYHKNFFRREKTFEGYSKPVCSGI
jgi:hypothetical protein